MIKPFQKIGIGVAFSPNLKANIHEASRLALYFDAQLVLIHVGDKSDKKENDLITILGPFIENNLNYEIVYQTGAPVDVILSVCTDQHIDLLILGAVQRENFLKYYVGSIARKITRQANCAVLLLVKPSIQRIPCEHVVVNGLQDPKTKQTIKSAFYVSHSLNANRITIVEEIEQKQVTVKVEDDQSLRKSNLIKERIRLMEDSRVQKIIEEVPVEWKEDLNIRTQPIFGKSGYSIGHYAQVVRADLLVMNAPNSATFWDRLFPHDMEHILTELPTDVLIIR